MTTKNPFNKNHTCQGLEANGKLTTGSRCYLEGAKKTPVEGGPLKGVILEQLRNWKTIGPSNEGKRRSHFGGGGG